MKESQNKSSFSFLISDLMITLTDSNLKITLLILPHNNTAMDGEICLLSHGLAIVSCLRKEDFFCLDIKMKKSKITFIVFFIAYFATILSASSSHHHKYSYIERKIRRENNPAEPCR